jgi:hypothetical protein
VISFLSCRHDLILRLDLFRYYDDNVKFHAFTPVDTDVLVAQVDFLKDTVAALRRTALVQGINSGYKSGDLQFKANMWGGCPLTFMVIAHITARQPKRFQ